MGQSLSRRRAVNADQREMARELRKGQTSAEALLWEALRGKRLAGLKFRRQQPVHGFVVDFYCEAKNLAVELDGAVHDGLDAQMRDRQRQGFLEAVGLRFLRFKNDEVEKDLAGVLARIERY